MFDFVKGYEFSWPVVALAPGPDGQREIKFTGVFRLIPEAELEAAVIADPGNANEVVVRLTFVRWKDDLLSGGKPIPYSEELRHDMFGLNFMRYAVASAYYAAMNGVVRLKN